MVKVKVVYFSLLRELTEKPEEYLEVGTTTVRAALQTLFNKYGDKMRGLILKKNDIPQDSLIINVNGKSIKFLHGLDTNLKEGDTLVFFFAAGGG